MQSFAPKGLLVVQAVPFDDPDWNYKGYAAANDYTMLMAYDQHYAGSDPGTVAAQDWYENNLVKRMQDLEPESNHHRSGKLWLRLDRR